MNVSIFENLKNPNCIGVETINGILHLIKEGYTMELVDLARGFGKGTTEYEQIKAKIPTFTPCAEFNQKRKLSNLKVLSGFIYLDIDGFSDKQLIANIPYTYACWDSLSAKGLGCLVRVSNLTKDNFLQTWIYLKEYFAAIGVTVDSQTKDISRQNVISFDPNIYVDYNSTILDANKIYNINKSNTSISSKQEPFYSSNITLNEFLGFETNQTQNQIEYNTNKEEELIYRTYLDDYQGLDYIIIEEGRPYRGVYLPKEINEGNRHKWLSAHIITLLFNNPTISYKRLEIELMKANNNHCNPKMDNKEVVSLTKWFYNLHKDNSLSITTKNKKIWFNPYSNLTLKEKRVIVGKEGGVLRRKSTLRRIQLAYDSLKSNNSKVTQKMIKNLTGISLRTIKSRWSEINK